jgi:hypothetical protein
MVEQLCIEHRCLASVSLQVHNLQQNARVAQPIPPDSGLQFQVFRIQPRVLNSWKFLPHSSASSRLKRPNGKLLGPDRNRGPGTAPQSLAAKPKVEFYNWLARSGESPTVRWNWSHQWWLNLLRICWRLQRLDRDLAGRYGIEMIAPHREGGEGHIGRASPRAAIADAGLWNDSSLGCIILAGSGSAGEYHVENFFGMVRRGGVQILLSIL